MKKVIFMFVAAAALTFAACTEEKKADAPAPEAPETEVAAPEAGDSAKAEAPEADKAAAPEADKAAAPEAEQK